MWIPLTLLVLAGIVSADFEHGWKTGNEYSYLVRSRTLTGLDGLSNQYAGIVMKALLTIQVRDPNTLVGKISKGQYSRIHKELPDGWDTKISDQMLELRNLPISETPFEIKMKHGTIRDLIVEKDVPTWEVNLMKSIISQLQVDTLGENAIKSSTTQVPNDEEPYGMFRAMEDTVSGMCEVYYDITPLSDHMLHMRPELVPMPQLRANGIHIDITKTKNFTKCDQRMNYYFGVSGQTNWEPGSNDNGNFLSKSSTSRIVISGSLRQFTIQSSVTTSQMSVSPRFYDYQNGIVMSRMNLTLVNMNRVSNNLPSPKNAESVGNLVYIYNNPFADFEERRPSKPMTGQASHEIQGSDSISSVSSSEEVVKNEWKHQLSESGSSSASSSSISSSEEHQFWQPKPTLEDAPQNPLLPYFVGYKGKHIGKSGEIDLVKATIDMVFQIANELEDPSTIPTQYSLEKFTILSSLVRLMNRKQIMETEKNMHISPNELKSNDKSQAVKQNAWAVFRDVITQTGTGPALLTIKNWIEKKVVEGWEAAEIVSRIPKNARTPTAQYIKTFFNMATNPKVTNQMYLNSTAILAFSDLVRLAQINSRTLHNRYPVHTFGRLVSKHDKTVIEEYIPFMERELKKAIDDGNSIKIQTYIIALGGLGHPKILSIFEPYLEGKKPVTNFQRMLIVASLSKLADIYPKLARSVLYKIYLNTMETHQVRCTAVFLLMKTNPPLSMLQRMAEFTNYDSNKHVNSAVKSVIESIASSINPMSQEMAKKAGIARLLFKPNKYGYEYSHGFLNEYIREDQNMVTETIINYIGSDDSIIPHALYIGLFASYGDFKIPETEITAAISSMRSVLDMVINAAENDDDTKKTTMEKIVEQLNIIPEEPKLVEGNLLWDSKFQTRFLPFDSNAIRKLPILLAGKAMAMKNMRYFNMNNLMSYDVTLSFPTDSGLPFVYTFRVPILYKLSGEGQLQVSPELNMKLKSNVRFVYSKKIQGRIGFVVPFEHQHFIAGVDMNFQTYAPIKLSLDFDRVKQGVQVGVLPIKGEEKARLFHYSVVPYTAIHDILNLRPMLTDKNTHVVEIDKKSKINYPAPIEQYPILKLEMEAEDSNSEFWEGSWDLENNFLSPLYLENDRYRKMDLFLNLEHEQKEPVTFTMFYESLNAEFGKEDLRQWSPTAKAFSPSKKAADSEQRRTEFLKEAVKGIKAGKSYVMDIELKTPSEVRSSNVLTVAWAENNIENKMRILFYWNFNLPEADLKYEMCAASHSVSTVNLLLPYEQQIDTKHKVDFDVDVRYGEACNSDSGNFNIRGKVLQSNEVKERLKKWRVVKECQEQMKQGNKMLSACEVAAGITTLLDEVEITMDMNDEVMRKVVNKIIDTISNIDAIDTHVDSVKPKNTGKSKIDVKAKLSKDLEKIDITVHTPTTDVSLNNLNLDFLGLESLDFLGVDEEAIDQDDQSTCVLDKTRAETFDSNSYPLRLGNCWHVVLTTYPKIDPEDNNKKLPIPKDHRLTILSRETSDGHKEVKVVLGDSEIMLMPSDSEPSVMVDGKQVQITQKAGRQEILEDEVLFEIHRLPSNLIHLVSDKYGVNLLYDGTRLMIKMLDPFLRGSVRGLCGNMDGDITNDFLAPQNCVLKKPELFIASYALTKDQCEGDSLANAKQIARSDCTQFVTNRQSNVISDIDAGRVSDESQKWNYDHEERRNKVHTITHRTMVIEENDKLCFSIRPVMSCATGSTPTETTSKNYQFHCMKKNETSLQLKKRVEKGANPDLSQKRVSMSRPVNIPLACQA